MKTTVLIHGCHRAVAGWEEIIWGNPQAGALGRVPKGIMEALSHDAVVLIFGSGLRYEDGTIESRYIFEYTLAHLDELLSITGMSSEALRAWLAERVHFDETSSKTDEEARYALSVAHEKGAEQFIFVSSPWHVLRCMKVALMESSARSEFSTLRRHLYAAVSDTETPALTVDEVVIFEPPHRPDRPPVFFNKTLKEIFPFLITSKADIALGFNDALKQFIEAWKQRL